MATRPAEGLSATSPQKLPGMRTDPPASVPTAAAPIPAASAAAPPPEEPPGVSAGSQGLRVTPVSGLSVTAFQPNSGVVVLPITTAPAARRRATDGASSASGAPGSESFEPRSVAQPRARMASLTVTATPSSGPEGAPRAQRASAAAAASRARPRSSKWQNGLSAPPCASIRS